MKTNTLCLLLRILLYIIYPPFQSLAQVQVRFMVSPPSTRCLTLYRNLIAFLGRSLSWKPSRMTNPVPNIPLLHPQQITWVPHLFRILFLPAKKPRPLCHVRPRTKRSTTLPLHLLHRVAAPPKPQSNIPNLRGTPSKNTKSSSEMSTCMPLPLPTTRILLFLQHELPLHPAPTTLQSPPGANIKPHPPCLAPYLILPR